MEDRLADLSSQLPALPYRVSPPPSPPYASPPPFYPTSQPTYNRPQPNQTFNSSPPLLPSPPQNSKPTQPPLRRLNPTQMDERCAEGFCFNCDEKYHRGHRCKAKLFLIVATNDEADELDDVVLPEEADPLSSVESSEITLHAFTGCRSPRTLRLSGSVAGRPIQILIDCSSTHNFIQPQICELLHLAIHPTKTFRVMVGNGDKLHCSGLIHRLPVQIQQFEMNIDCYLLPLQGADLILGVQWLEQLGTYSMNYRTMTMEFDWGDQHITWQGALQPEWEPIRPLHLHKLLQQDEIAGCFQLQVLPPQSAATTPAFGNISGPWDSILQEFRSLFCPPTDLPPPRPIDHQIILQPNTGPVRVCLYRYPHFQKEEISHLVTTML